MRYVYIHVYIYESCDPPFYRGTQYVSDTWYIHERPVCDAIDPHRSIPTPSNSKFSMFDTSHMKFFRVSRCSIIIDYVLIEEKEYRQVDELFDLYRLQAF